MTKFVLHARYLLALITVAGSIGSVFAASISGDDNRTTISTVNGMPIAASEIADQLASLDPATRRAAETDLNSLTQFVRSYALRQAVIAEAEAKNWPASAAGQAALKRARADAEVTGYIASIAKPPADFPAEADIRAAYDKNKDKLMRPAQFELQALSISLPTDADKAQSDKIAAFVNETVRKVKTDKEFEAIPTAKSAAGFSITYRNLGFLPVAQLAPELRAIISGMKIGDISPIIRLADQAQILRVRDMKGPLPLQYDEIHDQLADSLIRDRSNELASEQLKRIEQASQLAINQIAIEALLKKK